MRRITLQRQRQRWSKEVGWGNRLRQQHFSIAKRKLENYKNKLTKAYGFCVNRDELTCKNAGQYILQMTPAEFYLRPSLNMCHNYCEFNPMPPRTKLLLGLGLEFCSMRPRHTSNLNKIIKKLPERKDTNQNIIFF